MSLVSLKHILAEARSGGYAVGAFNVDDSLGIRSVIQAAEHNSAPVILAFGEAMGKYADIAEFAATALFAAGRSCVPVCIHLDHGRTFDGVVKAIRCGFSSVMFDGSALSFEDNVRQTKELVRIAHAVGVDVEAELGYVGRAEEIVTGSAVGLTSPDEVVEFIERTGVDALAVAIGNAHGVYRGTPWLDLERLAQIRRKADVPLVLHGGSGIGEDTLRQGIGLGICKVNIFTDLYIEARARTRETLGTESMWQKIMSHAYRGVEEVAGEKMRLFGSAGKA